MISVAQSSKNVSSFDGYCLTSCSVLAFSLIVTICFLHVYIDFWWSANLSKCCWYTLSISRLLFCSFTWFCKFLSDFKVYSYLLHCMEWPWDSPKQNQQNWYLHFVHIMLWHPWFFSIEVLHFGHCFVFALIQTRESSSSFSLAAQSATI